MFRQAGLGAGERLELVNFRIPFDAFLVQRNHPLRKDRSLVKVVQLNDRQIAFGKGRLTLQSFGKSAKKELVRTDAKKDRRAIVIPLASSGAEVDSAAVGNEASF